MGADGPDLTHRQQGLKCDGYWNPLIANKGFFVAVIGPDSTHYKQEFILDGKWVSPTTNKGFFVSVNRCHKWKTGVSLRQ